MFTYDPLWATLKKKNISQYSLVKDYGISSGTLDALRKNKSVTIHTLCKICAAIGCQLDDIVYHVPEKKK